MPCPRHAMAYPPSLMYAHIIGGPGGGGTWGGGLRQSLCRLAAGSIRCHDAGSTGGVLLDPFYVSSGPWGNTRLRHVIF